MNTEPNTHITPQSTVSDAIDYLAENIDNGVTCPCCDQFAKLYRRSLSSSTARVLIAMYLHNTDGWVYLPDLKLVRSDEAKARFWGLIQQRPGLREDGSARTGWWRLTHDGVDFVHNRLRVPKTAVIYNGDCLRLEGAPTSIVQCLGARFDYRALMSEAA